MTQAARRVLSDCEAALTDFRGSTGLEWRTRWVSVITLLRAVGHVLKKIDSHASPAAAAAIDAAHGRLCASRPEPKIFWEFIEQERNNLLKEYEFGAQQSVTVRPGGVWINMKTGESGANPAGLTSYSQLMRAGPFAGQDPCDVAAQAIAWWRSYLDSVTL